MPEKIPETLKKLALLLPCELYIVGGYIRNKILNIETEDIDICSMLTLDKLTPLLENSEFSVKIKNKFLNTALIVSGEEVFEYSALRKEIYDGGNHSPIKVEFIDEIKQDAARRDFTCNALYYAIKKEKMYDFYNGVEDIKRKILRAVEDPYQTLSVDCVRILRLFRFQCELNFRIDKDTLNAAILNASIVKNISGERFIYEITRILHSDRKYKNYSKPHAYLRAFKLFNKYSLWSAFGMDVPKIKLRMVKKVEHKSQGFLIDLIDTVNPISISYYLNLVLNNNFGINKKMAEQIINILSGYYDALNRLGNKEYFFKYFDNFPMIYLLLIHKSKYLALKYQFFYKYIINHKLVITVKDLKISGDDIKKHYPEVNPKRYKAIMDSLLSDVFEGKIENEKGQLVNEVEQKLKYL